MNIFQKRIVTISFILAFGLGLSSCRFFSCEHRTEQHQAIAVPAKTIFSFLGAPGSGKGTLSEQCVKQLGFKTISTGNLCREEIGRGSEKGKMLAEYTRTARLVPDEVITQMVEEWLAKQTGDQPIILDGYPRTQKQAQSLSEMLKSKFPDYKLRVVSLELSDYEPIIKRITDRLVCEKCHGVYNRSLMKDPNNMICEACADLLIRRDDDREEIVRKRFEEFDKNNNEIISYYKNSDIEVEPINASSITPIQLFDNFKEIIKK